MASEEKIGDWEVESLQATVDYLHKYTMLLEDIVNSRISKRLAEQALEDINLRHGYLLNPGYRRNTIPVPDRFMSGDVKGWVSSQMC